MQQDYDVSVRWRSYPLHPDIPPEGMDYRAYFGGDAGWEAGAERLTTMAGVLGVPFRMPERKYNSQRAEELTAWAVQHHPHVVEALRSATFHAIWVDGLNNDDPEVLADLAASSGIPKDDVADSMAQREGRAAVEADWHEAMRLRIRGVPMVFIGERAVVGAQPWPVFEAALEAAGVARRADGE